MSGEITQTPKKDLTQTIIFRGITYEMEPQQPGKAIKYKAESIISSPAGEIRLVLDPQQDNHPPTTENLSQVYMEVNGRQKGFVGINCQKLDDTEFRLSINSLSPDKSTQEELTLTFNDTGTLIDAWQNWDEKINPDETSVKPDITNLETGEVSGYIVREDSPIGRILGRLGLPLYYSLIDKEPIIDQNGTPIFQFKALVNRLADTFKDLRSHPESFLLPPTGESLKQT